MSSEWMVEVYPFQPDRDGWIRDCLTFSPSSSCSAVILSFLFSYWLSHRVTQDGSRAQQMALHTLKMMANGGIRDHVGQVRGRPGSLERRQGW